MEDAEAGSGEGSSGASAVERGVMRNTLRELLFEIPGFQTLAERGIPGRVSFTDRTGPDY